MEQTQTEELRTVDEWSKVLKTPAWQLMLAKQMQHWAVGDQTTKAEYMTAMSEAANYRVG